MTGSTVAFLRRVLCTQGTYEALLNGEVPYYYRNLDDPAHIFDEQGNQFDSAGCSKVTDDDISTEMTGRRTEVQQNGDDSEVYAIFEAQIIALVRDFNNEVRTILNPV